jgi:hypothetical protein
LIEVVNHDGVWYVRMSVDDETVEVPYETRESAVSAAQEVAGTESVPIVHERSAEILAEFGKDGSDGNLRGDGS